MTRLSTSYTTWIAFYVPDWSSIVPLQHASRHTVGARATFCPPKGSGGGMYTGFRSSGPKLGVSSVPNRSPRVAGITQASVVTILKMGQHAKYATSSTYTDTTLGLITTLSVIYPGSGYLVVLGKHLRGSFVTRVEHGTVRKVDQNAKVSKREIRTPGGV